MRTLLLLLFLVHAARADVFLSVDRTDSEEMELFAGSSIRSSHKKTLVAVSDDAIVLYVRNDGDVPDYEVGGQLVLIGRDDLRPQSWERLGLRSRDEILDLGPFRGAAQRRRRYAFVNAALTKAGFHLVDEYERSVEPYALPISFPKAKIAVHTPASIWKQHARAAITARYGQRRFDARDEGMYLPTLHLVVVWSRSISHTGGICVWARRLAD